MNKFRILSWVGIGLTAVGAVITALVGPTIQKQDALEAAQKVAETANK